MSWIVIVEFFFLICFNYFVLMPVEADYVIDLNSSPPMEEPEQNVNHLVEDLGKLNHNIYLNIRCKYVIMIIFIF